MSKLSGHLRLLGELCHSERTCLADEAHSAEFQAWCHQEKIDNFLRWHRGIACDMQWTVFSMRYEHVLHELYTCLERAKVRFAALKGADLCFRVYPHPSIRSFSDIDLLIHEEDWDRAGQALSSDGWTISNWEISQRHHHASPITKKGIILEPHWTLPKFEGISVNEIWEHLCCESGIGFRHVLTTEMNLLMLSQHLSERFYLVNPLGRFLLDVFFLLQKEKVDWGKLRQMCLRWHLPYPGDLLGAFPEFFSKDLLSAAGVDNQRAENYRWIFEHREAYKHTNPSELHVTYSRNVGHWLSGLSYRAERCKFNLPEDTSWLVLTCYQLRDGWKKLCQLFCLLGKHQKTGVQEYLSRVKHLE